jgi:hypothetical protein
MSNDFSTKLYSFEAIYDNEESKKVFKDYMKETFVLEMAEFMEQIDDYVVLRSTVNRKHKAKKIIETFLLPNAPAEINIPQTTREKILLGYEDALNNKKPFSPNLFSPAQIIVSHDLTFDVFPRFVETKMFTALMESELKNLGEKLFKQTYLLSEEQMKDNTESFDAYKQFKDGLNSDLEKSKLHVKQDSNQVPLRFKFENEEIQPLLKYFNSLEYINELIVEMAKPIVGCPLYKSKGLFAKNSNKREILGSELIKWIQSYTFLESESPIVELVEFLVLKKILIPKELKKTKFDPKITYSFGFKKRIVVLFLFLNIRSLEEVLVDCGQPKDLGMNLKSLWLMQNQILIISCLSIRLLRTQL